VSTEGLKGASAALTISDPWEFGSKCGTGPFRGRIVDQVKQLVLFSFLTPVDFQGVTYSTAIVSARHEAKDLSNLLEGSVAVNALLLHAADTDIDFLEREGASKGLAVIGSIAIE